MRESGAVKQSTALMPSLADSTETEKVKMSSGRKRHADTPIPNQELRKIKKVKDEGQSTG
jgi:hypothetical protein